MGQICSTDVPDRVDPIAELDQKPEAVKDVKSEDQKPDRPAGNDPEETEEKRRLEQEAEEKRIEEEKKKFAEGQAEAKRKFEQKEKEAKEKIEEEQRRETEAAEKERLRLIAEEEEQKKRDEEKAEAEKKETEEAEAKKKAAEKDQKTMKDFLSTNGFQKVNDKKKKGGFGGSFTFPLLEAAHQNKAELVRILLENGADMKMQTKKKKTVLEKAEKMDQDGSHAKVIGFLKARQTVPGGAA